MECKRVASSKKLAKNVYKANKQLVQRKKVRGTAGLIAMDVSRVINPTLEPLRANSVDQLIERAGAQLHELLEEHVGQIQKKENRSNATLGVLVRYVEGGYARTNADVRRYSEWSIAQLHDDVEPEACLFRDIAERLGNEPIIVRWPNAPPNWLAGFIAKQVNYGRSKAATAAIDSRTCLGAFYLAQGVFETNSAMR